MCVNMKRFYNKWTHSWQYAKCGHCPACEQEKAFKRTQRISNASYNGYTKLFITLTYSNDFVPYIKRTELFGNPSKVTIYRQASVRYKRIGSSYDTTQVVERGERPIAEIDCFQNRLFPSKSAIKQLPKLKGFPSKGYLFDSIGVLYFKDIQDFEKRLRVNLQRRFGVTKPVYTFKVTEYGPTTQRPHAHLLLDVPTESVSVATSAVMESWPYCDISQWNERTISVAVNAASYVSSYVNRGEDFPSLLSVRAVRPKHTFSKFYGLQNNVFSLESILNSLQRGDLSYVTNRDRMCQTESLTLYPSYALNRYFFKFKGYSRLTNSDLRKLVADPNILFDSQRGQRLRDLIGVLSPDESFEELRFDKDGFPYMHSEYYIDYQQIKSVINCIECRVKRFLNDFVYYEDGKKYQGLPDNLYTRCLFADYYFSVWRCYASRIYRLMFEQVENEVDLLECYYNLDDVRNGLCHSDLQPLIDKYPQISNPNLFHHVMQSSINQTRIYDKMNKSRRVTNKAMSNADILV